MDTGSNDRTLEIAQAAGCVIGHFAWCDDFAAARNASLSLASGEWILVIDADERFDPSTKAAFERAVADTNRSAWLVDVDSVGQNDEHCVAPILRLFRRRDDVRFERAVHESITGSLVAAGLDGSQASGVRLVHEGYRPDVLQERDKHARNLALLERAYAHDPDDVYAGYKLATTQRGDGQHEQAASTFERVLEALDRLDALALAQLPFARRASADAIQLALDLGRMRFAREEIARANLRWPRGDLGAEGWLARAEAALRLESFDEATTAFERAGLARSMDAASVANSALDRRLVVESARCALEAGRPDEAARRVRTQDAAGTPGAVAIGIRAELRQGNLEAAFEQLGNLLEGAPAHPETLLIAGEIAWWRGERESARDLWSGASGTSLAARRAQAWQIIDALAVGDDERLNAQLQRAVAVDVTSAAASVLAFVAAGSALEVDPSFEPPALMNGVGRWLEELLQSEAIDVVERFANRAAQHADRWQGIQNLIVRG